MSIFMNNKNFRLLATSNFVSTIGDKLFYIALLTYVSTFSNSTLAIGLVSISELLPTVLASYIGYRADQTKRRFSSLCLSSIIRSGLYLLIGLSFVFVRGEWTILLIAIMFNFISDLFGQFTASALIPLTVISVGKEQFNEAIGFTNGISQLINLFAQFFGASLLLFLSYQNLAFINSGTFLFSLMFLLVFFKQNKALRVNQLHEVDKSEKMPFLATLKVNLIRLKKEQTLFPVVSSIIILNACLTSISSLLQMLIALNTSMVIGTYSFTIAIIGFITTSGMALGSLIGTKLLKNLPLSKLLIWDLTLLISFFCSLFLTNLYLSLGLLFPITFFIGVVIPKLSAWVVSIVPQSELGNSIGIVNSLLTAATPLFSLIIISLASIFNLYLAIAFVICLSFFGLALMIRNLRVEKTIIQKKIN
ncbi:hypothetical protein ATZ33_06300 [Enterococcus silesiacus]|uniref:Major facilitator superfamily (MFS) profile domain-containing protein n=1 Tax=Enterococcus silesiacus TaxID=332949 RepID=A0A0S3K9R9_9ENTE|nr:MFS transporter [Enterococcus silesiacus]ALS00990.1 hypothetical protein ATZ33_06300 [Enterococcus silesiacus]OJG91785.1 hypothetical protein RV15_GL000452 [Enterococcus silesiacus]